MKYNAKPDHLYHRVAARIKTNVGPVLDNLHIPPAQPLGLPPSVGDLEPLSDVLSLLLSTAALEDHTTMIIDTGDPIGTLFAQLPLRIRTPPVATAPPKKPRGRPSKAAPAWTAIAQQPDGDPQNVTGVGSMRRTRAQQADINQKLRGFAVSSEPAGSVVRQNTKHSVPHDKSPPVDSSPPVGDPQINISPAPEAELTPEQQAREAQRALRRERERAKREKLLARRERDRVSREKWREKKRELKRMRQEQRVLEPPLSVVQGESQEVTTDGTVLEPTIPQGGAVALSDSFTALNGESAEGSKHEHGALAQYGSGRQSRSEQDYQDPEGNYPGVESANSHPQQASFNTMPQLVERVDDKQSFQMFNEGWMLPEGSSRRGNQGSSLSGQTGRGGGRNLGPDGPEGAAARERQGKPSELCGLRVDSEFMIALQKQSESKGNDGGRETGSDDNVKNKQNSQLLRPSTPNPPIFAHQQ